MFHREQACCFSRENRSQAFLHNLWNTQPCSLPVTHNSRFSYDPYRPNRCPSTYSLTFGYGLLTHCSGHTTFNINTTMRPFDHSVLLYFPIMNLTTPNTEADILNWAKHGQTKVRSGLINRTHGIIHTSNPNGPLWGLSWCGAKTQIQYMLVLDGSCSITKGDHLYGQP